MSTPGGTPASSGQLPELVRLRASQLNGCAYCVELHWKDLRALGQSEQRLYALSAWQESPGYTEKERAVLAWTEAVTRVEDGRVPDGVHALARAQVEERELCQLTLAIAAINAWNRVAIAFRAEAGKYKPAAHG